LLGYKDKAFIYDSIIVKYLNYEKENVNQFEKIKKYSRQIEDFAKIKEDYDVQLNNVRILNEKLEIYDRKEGVNQTEKKRLKKLEDALAYSQQRAKDQEDEILKLVKLIDKTNLENEIKALTTDFNRK
jgi:hypothetical protein